MHSDPASLNPAIPALPVAPSLMASVASVLRVALPLMVSAGTNSVVLFTDRTLLLWYEDGSHMSAAMAAGNLFWTLICLPVGLVSMTGAIVAQFVGSGKRRHVGRFMWQSVWFSLAMFPVFALLALAAPWMFTVSGQPAELIAAEASYLRIMLLGAVGCVMEAGLSGFFSGTQRTRVIMLVSLACGIVNMVLDVWFIFGGLGIPPLGIAGAAWASVFAFWFKVFVYAALLLSPALESRYRIRRGMSWHRGLLGKLLYYGTPSGLQHLTEAGVFTLIVLQIGRLGDVPLRATTMAINFNMIAFIPLIGLSIATSVLVGHHLTASGVAAAKLATRSALLIGLGYSALWCSLFSLAPQWLLSFYRLGQDDPATLEAIALAKTLLWFVALYVLFDSIQLILAGALRGAGDTWFVLSAAIGVTVTSFIVGHLGQPLAHRLGISLTLWWWGVITALVVLLAAAMSVRYLSGRWQQIRMVN